MATATERVRNYRDRKRRGVEVVSIEVDAMAIGALAFKNYLRPDDPGLSDDRPLGIECLGSLPEIFRGQKACVVRARARPQRVK